VQFPQAHPSKFITAIIIQPRVPAQLASVFQIALPLVESKVKERLTDKVINVKEK
jgi:hypothetical protein